MIERARLKQLVDEFGTRDVEETVISRFLAEHQLDSKSFAVSRIKPANQFISMWLDAIDDARDLANILEVLIPEKDQKLNGAFFTPRYIVDFIIRELKPHEQAQNFDPSCGCGAFLAGLVDYYQQQFGKSVRTIVRENIFGADILEYNIDRTKIVLSAMALENGEILQDDDFNLWHTDSLRTEWQQSFDTVLGNPPYVKFQDLTDENRSFLSRNWDTVTGGTFNLYFAFFELGYKLLSEEGKLGYITPNNYFTSLSGEALRRFFHQTKAVSRIVDFSHRKVFDAQTYTAITFLDKKEKSSILYDRIKDNQESETFLDTANGSINRLDDLNVKKWRLLKKDEQEIVRYIENRGTPIGQLFDIVVGIATLKDDVFFVDGLALENGKYLKNSPAGTFSIEPEITRAVFKISDFSDQEQIDNNRRRIICPYEFSSGMPKVIPESIFATRFPGCFEYLLSERERLATRDKGKLSYDPFFSWGRTQGLSRKGKKLLTPTFSKFPRFLVVKDENSYFTNGYGVFFREQSNSLFEDFSAGIADVNNIDVVQKVLNSGLMHYYVTKTSVAIEGGYPCYQKNFIERFTIPDLSQQEIETLRVLDDQMSIDTFLCERYGIKVEAIRET